MGRFYYVRTVHGGIFAVDAASPDISGYPPERVFDQNTGEPTSNAIFAYFSDFFPRVCFFVGVQPEIRMKQASLRARVIPFGVTERSGSTVSFYDLGTGEWACAAPSMQEVGCEIVFFGRRIIDAYEKFGLLAIDDTRVPEAVSSHVHWLESQSSIAHRDLYQACLEGSESFEMASYLADPESVKTLANRLLLERPTTDFSRATFKHPIDRRAFVNLRAWLADRTQTASGMRGNDTLTPELDDLAEHANPANPFSASLACVSAMRRLVDPRRDVCLVASARNEGVYLLEWIAYHRSIGIRDITIYSNNNDDGSDELLAALAKAGVIRWITNEISPGYNAQRKAYGHALYADPEILDYRWALFIDIDEYFMFNHDYFKDVQSFLAWHEIEYSDAIALNWVGYGSAGQGRWRDDFVIRRFDHSQGINPIIKSMFRPRYFNHATPHYPTAWRDQRLVTRKNDRHPYTPYHTDMARSGAAEPNSNVAWIGHFFYRSTEEYMVKFSRNRGDEPTSVGIGTKALTPFFLSLFVKQFDMPKADERSTAAMLPPLEEEYGRLRGLPGVDAANQASKRRYAARLSEVVALFSTAPSVLEAGDEGQRFLRSLDAGM